MPSPPLPTIVLLGPRGVGKTILGRSLARRLDRRFVDLDDWVRGRFNGATIAEIWRTAGEPAWREAESEGLAELLKDLPGDGQLRDAEPSAAPTVVALGGGAPMVPGVQKTLQAARDRGAIVSVLLLASVATLERRLRRGSSQRPSLTGRNPAAEVGSVLRSRLPTYRTVADVEVPLDGLTRERSVDAVLRALEGRPSR